MNSEIKSMIQIQNEKLNWLKSNLKKLGLNRIKEHRLIWLVIIGTFAIALTWDYSSAKQKEVDLKIKSDIDVDTFIPSGFTIVPIEVQNLESLDSMFGRYGVVSLYESNLENPQNSKKVAERIKMIRAPNDPRQFGVLVKEADAPELAKNPGPYFVVVHSRDTKTGPVGISKKQRQVQFKIIEE